MIRMTIGGLSIIGGAIKWMKNDVIDLKKAGNVENCWVNGI
jgi:hypothetical protein